MFFERRGRMQFTKMHGLGNSFIILNLLESQIHDQSFSLLSMKVSNVNFGIGADGTIFICSSRIADFRMRIFNSDGSEARNCGNGIRCVAKYLFDHMYATTTKFTLETLGGVVRVEVETDKKQIVRYVTVDMGEPKLLKKDIPMNGTPIETTIHKPVCIGNQMFHLTCVSMGNPHAILFVNDVNDFPLEEIGPTIECSDLFPDRVNVGIVSVLSKEELQYRVWERGVGMTMACGTGACAAVVAAILNNRLERNHPTTVHLPGGELIIRWDEDKHVWMSGKAAYICHGELEMSMNKVGGIDLYPELGAVEQESFYNRRNLR